MAIKIECSLCGFQNDLGRVFCASCATKLDLRATSANDLRSLERRQGLPSWARLLVAGALVGGLLAIAGLACWPGTLPGVLYDKGGGVQVPIKAKAVLAAVSYKRSVSLTLTEGELNGYLADRARSKKFSLLAVDLKPGAFDLYLVDNLTLPAVATNVAWLARARLPVSMSMRGSFKDGLLGVETARLGHLPLLGPVKSLVVKRFEGIFADIVREKRFTSSLKSVALEEAKADLVLGP